MANEETTADGGGATAGTAAPGSNAAETVPKRRGRDGGSERFGTLSWPVALGALAAAVAIAFGGVALGGAFSSASGQQEPGAVLEASSSSSSTVSVTGSATVRGVPDTLHVNLGVHTTASSATAALAANNTKMSALEAALRRNGVPSTGMQTANLNVYDNTNNSGAVTGFSVDDDLTVTMHDLKKAGTILDAAANAAGNGIRINGLSFSISNQSALLASARAKAMANAHAEAVQLARGAGLGVGRLVRVTAEGNSSPPSYPVFAGAALRASAAAVPLSPGRQSISVNVSAVYAIG